MVVPYKANKIHKYKQIALECLISENGKSIIKEI